MVVHWEDWHAESAFILLIIVRVRDELLEHLETDLTGEFVRKVLQPKSISIVAVLVLSSVVDADVADIGCSGYKTDASCRSDGKGVLIFSQGSLESSMVLQLFSWKKARNGIQVREERVAPLAVEPWSVLR